MTELEKIIRPIVEGQIRGFLKEHPSVLDGVLWFKLRTDKETTFVNSLGKRIVRDLTSGDTAGRLRAALLDNGPGNVEGEAVAHHSAASGGGSGIRAGAANPANKDGKTLLRKKESKNESI